MRLYNQHPRRGAHGRRDQQGEGKRSGDASFEGSNRRLLQLFTPHAEAERLGFKIGRKTGLERQRIKTQSRFKELINLEVAKSLAQSL